MRTLLLLLLSLLASLASANPAEPPVNVVAFAYGTSYGECMGYCAQELRISGDKVEFLASGAYQEADPQSRWGARAHRLEDVHSSLRLSAQETGALWRLIVSVRYADMPERLGFPDCNDGGAEWIEFTSSDHKTKKIMFEKGKAPSALLELAERCNQIQQRFKTPDDWRRNLRRSSASQ